MAHTPVVLGVLGCASPHLAVRFFEVLTARTPARRDQDHFHVLITTGRDDSQLRSVHRSRVLLRAAAGLRVAGASLLVIPSGSDDRCLDDIENAVGLPVLRWVDAAVAAARRVAGPTAIVTGGANFDAEAYRRGFQRAGAAYLLPPPEVLALLHSCADAPPERAATQLISACQQLGKVGASSVLLACEQLASVAERTALPLPVIDPSITAAERILQLRLTDAQHPTCA